MFSPRVDNSAAASVLHVAARVVLYLKPVAVLEFSFWGATGVATLSSGGGAHN